MGGGRTVQGDFFISTEACETSTLIACSGELDTATSPRLEEAIAAVLRDKPPHVLLDTSDVGLISSTGIQILLNLARTCSEAGITLTFVMSAPVRRILDLAGVWWLGVVDDGIAIHDALCEEFSAHTQESRGVVIHPLGLEPEGDAA